MKKFKKLSILLISMLVIFACSDYGDELVKEMSDVELKSAQPITVTVPFEVNLLGEITNLDWEAQDCIDEGYAVRAIVETSGNATHMGKVSFTFNFCSAGAPDPNIPGSYYTYAALSSELIAANGDKLFLDYQGGSGILGRTDTHPDYVMDYWRGMITVTGGTGRFEGASGELLYDDSTTNIDSYTHHHWTGTITLVKGKRKAGK